MAVRFMPQTWNSVCGKVRLSLGSGWEKARALFLCRLRPVTSPGREEHSSEQAPIPHSHTSKHRGIGSLSVTFFSVANMAPWRGNKLVTSMSNILVVQQKYQEKEVQHQRQEERRKVKVSQQIYSYSSRL